MSVPPLSLYVHFPWCVAKCPYCDFNSHALREALPEARYIDALIRDLDFELDGQPSRPVTSIFMGGGTPSLFSGGSIGRLLEAVARRVPLAPGVEITLEANPGTVDESHFREYRAAGVNRLSLGVQSLDDGRLKKLGRIHDAGTARRAYDSARKAGFANVNLDLMFALPGQSAAEAESEIRALSAWAPEHVSYYHLTVEPNTEFHARPPELPDSDAAAGMLDAAQALLGEAGYRQYEVSAYARGDNACRHNLNYWRFGDYLGIGAGAHGKVTRGGRVIRRARQKHPRTYLDGAGTAAAVQEERSLAPADLPFEYTMNALRLNAGFSLGEFTASTGLAAAALQPALRRAAQTGLVETAGDQVVPTALGRAHLNRLMALFLPA